MVFLGDGKFVPRVLSICKFFLS
ncbi:hypothetical protein HU200_014518 [Digitaria exilis]|uniref:Uncharacterized protein n=1 Tax=Digitaria exilis TaxID=1010633 RepID=A0A835KMU1_9POAL|nr:hypothetical protein HU200_014518 [Digitaria exilis]